uniref:Reverse transcriptase domain-containing protein n=1 Tax=Haemonchus contortus TaxID=6289 RepID=A0A7I4YW80_HAECO
MAIGTSNARTLASGACKEDLTMQARKIKYDVIGLTEAKRHRPLHAVFENGEERGTIWAPMINAAVVRIRHELRRAHPRTHDLAHTREELRLGTWDSRGVGGVCVLVNTHMAINID